jgi:hypothetical protein
MAGLSSCNVHLVTHADGVKLIGGHSYLELEDVCAQYQSPCIMDIKVRNAAEVRRCLYHPVCCSTLLP